MAPEPGFMGLKSARLRPDSASIFHVSRIHCDPSRMPKFTSFLRVFTETGPLVAIAVAIALLIGIAGPASAQFFNFGGFGGPPQRQAPQRGGGGWFGGDFFTPFQQQQQSPQAPRQDFSRAPGPAKRDTTAERNVLVIGDAMADWLGYGLEDAYSEQPDMGVIRKHKTVSGLIKYQPRGEPADWAAAARSILATEKPDAIVVMLGIHDRQAIREAATEKKTDKKDEKKDPRAKSDAKTRTPNRRTRRNRSRKVRRKPPRPTLPKPTLPRPTPQSRAKNPATPNWTTPKTMRRPTRHRKRPRARAAASMNSATSAGSNSTPRRSKS